MFNEHKNSDSYEKRHCAISCRMKTIGHLGSAFSITYLFRRVLESGISSFLLGNVICYRIHTILCARRVGFGGKFEEGGRRLEHFVA
jgi:hypothetical protein